MGLAGFSSARHQGHMRAPHAHGQQQYASKCDVVDPQPARQASVEPSLLQCSVFCLPTGEEGCWSLRESIQQHLQGNGRPEIAGSILSSWFRV